MKTKRKNSRAKGVRGELELAALLTNLLGVECRRGQQFSGIEGKDVVGVPGLHIECKRVEQLRLYEAVDQAKRDAAGGEVPIVVHRPSGRPWVAIVELSRLPELATLVYLMKASEA